MKYKLDFNERADSLPDWLNDFQINTEEMWKYPVKSEVESLIAKKFNSSRDNIFLSNGGDESIELLFKLCKLNDFSILLPLPAFSQYTHNLSVWNVENTMLPSLENLEIDLQAVEDNLKKDQWLVITRPNNPTGEYISNELLKFIIETAGKAGAYVFVDEAYIEFCSEEEPINFSLQYDNVVCLRTFSKAYGLAGARLGYLTGCASLISEFRNIAMPFNVSRPNLQLAKAALQHEDETRIYCRNIIQNRETVFEFLKTRNIKVLPGQGNFLLIKPGKMKKKLLVSYLKKNDIAIKDNVIDLPDWVRITIPQNIDKLLECLKTVFKPNILGFDMDGVLIDTSQSYDSCISETVLFFTQVQIQQSDITRVREQGGFNNDWDLCEQLIKERGFKTDYQKKEKKFQQLYNGDINRAGLKEKEQRLLHTSTLDLCFNSYYTSAIITGRPRDEAISGVEMLEINPDYVISADDVSEQKPSPEGLEKIKSKLENSRMWFCGDTVDDMQAGTAANCVCIGIGSNKENMYQAGADIVLENINQIKELL